MTPQEIIDQAREFANMENSTFVTDGELLNYLNQGLKIASHQTDGVEQQLTFTSVADQSAYTIPTGTFLIKWARYDGFPIQFLDFREADIAKNATTDSTSSGVPSYYTYWGDQIELIPTPDTTGKTVDVITRATHDTLLITGTVVFFDAFHQYFIDYVAYRIFLKEGNIDKSSAHLTLWNNHVSVMKRENERRRHGQRYMVQKDEDQIIRTNFGQI